MTNLSKFLSEAKRLSERATKRPWVYKKEGAYERIEAPQYEPAEPICAFSLSDFESCFTTNAEFITFAANHFDTLVSAVEKMKEALEYYEHTFPHGHSKAKECLAECEEMIK